MVADGVDMGLVDLVGLEKFFYFDFGGFYRLDRDRHDSHEGDLGRLFHLINQVDVVDIAA